MTTGHPLPVTPPGFHGPVTVPPVTGHAWEVWVEYLPTTHQGVTVQKAARMVEECSTPEEAIKSRDLHTSHEQAARLQSHRLAQPHHTAVYSAHERRTQRTLI